MTIKEITITGKSDYDLQLNQFETALLTYLESKGLPAASILVNVPQRVVVFANIDPVLQRIQTEQIGQSVYISKFLAATASGLFDAALNYLWDQTMLELKKRIAQYDLSYFFDNAVKNPERRKKLSTEEDLNKLEDSELVQGGREIELISEMGIKHLDYIRFMRNWASAAHPNQNQITGLQLLSWLETCVIEVISLPISNVGVEIKKLLANIKDKSISAQDAKEIATFFLNLTQDQVNTLAAGFWGLYTRTDTSPLTRQNVIQLLPHLWNRVDENHREGFGIKFGKFVANNLQEEKKFARELLELVGGLQYIPDDLKATDIQTAIDNLLIAHRGYSNFYSEPLFARELSRLVKNGQSVPSQINRNYLLCLTQVFITNGNGVAWNAESYYKEMLGNLNQNQAIYSLLSFKESNISNRLQYDLCRKKYKELIEIIRPKITYPAVLDLIDDLERFKGPMDLLKMDSGIMRKLENVLKAIELR